jgi:hypothetical protein
MNNSEKRAYMYRLIAAGASGSLLKHLPANTAQRRSPPRIEWEQKIVNNLPNNNISSNTFKNGAKAIKIDRFRYVTQNTLERLASRSASSMFAERNKNKVMFENPFTRQNVKRGDLQFVKLKLKSKSLFSRLSRKGVKK